MYTNQFTIKELNELKDAVKQWQEMTNKELNAFPPYVGSSHHEGKLEAYQNVLDLIKERIHKLGQSSHSPNGYQFPPHDWRLGRYPEGEYDIEEPEERPIKLTITKHERTPNITFDTVAPVCIRRVDMPEDGGKLKSKEFIGRAASVAEAIANLQESFPYGNLDPIQYNMDCIVVSVAYFEHGDMTTSFYAIYLEKPE